MVVRTESRRGFTLIELVIVLLIIAALAGLLIPAIGMIGRSSDMATSAKTQADLANSIQLFFVMQKRYPQGLDSLLDSTDAIYAPPAASAPSSDDQTFGLPVSGSDGTWMGAGSIGSTVGQLQPSTALTSNQARSLTRSGLGYAWDHALTGNSNNSAIPLAADANKRTIASGEIVAQVIPAGALQRKLAPAGLEPGTMLVAFGVGPYSTAMNKTVLNSPIYPGCDGRYYGRYIAIFKVYDSGERATLSGVVDSYGRTPDYTQQQFSESLPDGGRQG